MTSETDSGDAPKSMFSTCSRCGVEVRTSELWAHTAHAHNVDIDAKKPKGRGKSRDRGGRS